jgi:amino acid transporter
MDSTTGQAPSRGISPARPGDQVFLRQATGLVREASTFDATVFNLIWASLPLGLAIIFLYGPGLYLHANFYWTAIFALLLALPIAVTYALLASAMPRSGADYVWVTRSVHPALGFMSNLSFNFWVTYFIGIYATLLGSWGLSSVFRVLAAYTGNHSFLNPADFFVTQWGVFILGTALVLLSGILFIFGRGIETFLRFQRWGFVLWMLGGIVLAGIVVLFTDQAGFVSHFNHYVTQLGGPANAFALAVKKGGYTPTANTFGGTALAVTLPYYVLGFLFQSVYFGGEIKRGRGVHLVSIVGSLFVAVALILFFIWIFLRAIGMPFLAAAGVALPSDYGLKFAPLYAEMAAIAANNIVIGLLIVLGFTIGFVVWVPQTIVLISRGLFAWSFDRLVPEAVADINPRTHSPINATLIIMVAGMIAVIVVALNPSLSAVVGLFGLTITYVCVSIAGILFPYRQRDTFEASPYKQRLAGIPILSIVSAISLVTALIIEWILLTDQNSGTSWALNQKTDLVALGVFFGGLPLYYILRAIQRSRGIDVDLAYKEIPPD